ncbi:hypothetical protein BGZ46_000559 [Entomortierella lignicola]|nr:hypothetical protein BGZ46_000559 [Entomortierella lignicola]KAF9209579.1 hypothetical protein BGZ49_003066 [Haplosporangium sp. Z 27]
MLGRGIFYLSMGCLCLAWKWFNIVVGCVIMAVGVFYIGMHFLGATPSPSMSAVPAPTYNNVDRNYPHDENYIHPEDDEYEQKAPQSYQSPVVGTSYGARE